MNPTTEARRRGRPRNADDPAFLSRARSMAEAVANGRPVKAIAYEQRVSLPTAYRAVAMGQAILAAESNTPKEHAR
ncbi:MAG: hypothetical protein U0800_08505 [Isosphaeraceae bacterium]